MKSSFKKNPLQPVKVDNNYKMSILHIVIDCKE